eukprot:scaffold1717_cov377-Prasinococcus_capsulatus_cf.AAC.10
MSRRLYRMSSGNSLQHSRELRTKPFLDVLAARSITARQPIAAPVPLDRFSKSKGSYFLRLPKPNPPNRDTELVAHWLHVRLLFVSGSRSARDGYLIELNAVSKIRGCIGTA